MQTGEVDTESTPTPRQRRAARAAELTEAAWQARVVGDQATARALFEQLDDLYVAGAYMRNWQAEVRRLRRLLREAA